MSEETKQPSRVTKTNTRKQQLRGAAFRVLLLVAILLGVNILAAWLHKSVDLTAEKRFTLSASTQQLLNGLDDVVVVDVYLDGSELRSGFKRLREATREKLQAFKEVAGSKLVFRFSNPLAGKNDAEIGTIAKDLYEKGVKPMSVNIQEEANSSQQIIYPYALVQYKGRSMAVHLLERHPGMDPLGELNYSESTLEYKLGSAIHSLQRPDKPRIGYILGHGELNNILTFDLRQTLDQYYKVDTIDLPAEWHINDAVYDAIIINRPTMPFDENDKFKIDQYVMRGGKVLWALDAVNSPIDSLRKTGQFLTQDYDLNLDDLLFKYGYRVNTDLIEDAVQMHVTPLMVGTMPGGQPNIEMRPWTFLPVFVATSKHPIVQNLGPVIGRFVSSIDTISVPDSRKTILLESSGYSRSTPSPVRVSLSMLRYPPDPKLFRKPFRPAAVLAEGTFYSLYQNRVKTDMNRKLDSLRYSYKAQSDTSNAMIVISDGDIMINEYSSQRGPTELGYYQYTNTLFANKTFILNCLEYLTDPGSMLDARSKDAKLRLLDAKRVKEEKTQWQAINLLVPVGLILVFASVFIFIRKRKYEQPEPDAK
jgi:gliding-associated putative ABC transporter substrate-binding component GldG